MQNVCSLKQRVFFFSLKKELFTDAGTYYLNMILVNFLFIKFNLERFSGCRRKEEKVVCRQIEKNEKKNMYNKIKDEKAV